MTIYGAPVEKKPKEFKVKELTASKTKGKRFKIISNRIVPGLSVGQVVNETFLAKKTGEHFDKLL